MARLIAIRGSSLYSTQGRSLTKWSLKSLQNEQVTTLTAPIICMKVKSCGGLVACMKFSVDS